MTDEELRKKLKDKFELLLNQTEDNLFYGKLSLNKSNITEEKKKELKNIIAINNIQLICTKAYLSEIGNFDREVIEVLLEYLEHFTPLLKEASDELLNKTQELYNQELNS